MAEEYGDEDMDRVRDGRRQLSIDCPRIECRLYRRTRTSADFQKHPPHLLYMVRCRWSGPPTPGKVPSIYPDALLADFPLKQAATTTSSEGSPRWHHRQKCIHISRRSHTHPWRRDGDTGKASKSYCGNDGCWWDTLPGTYSVRRRWQDIERFHEALISELAFDKERGCRRVKARIPSLPNKADLDAFWKGCAATGDAMAMNRRKALPGEDTGGRWDDRLQSMSDLDDQHWIYVEKRLMPYFAEVNRLLREVPTEVLLCSHALRHFVTAGGVTGWSQANARKAAPVVTRFLGPLVPLKPDEDELAAAAKQHIRRVNSAPSLVSAGTATLKATG